MADPDRTVLTESDITDPGPLRTALNNSAGAGPVKSVNGKTGDVTLSADDIGALPAGNSIYGGHADEAPPGSYWIAGGVPLTPENGYPGGLPASSVAVLTTRLANGPAYQTQTLTLEDGTEYRRIMRANSWKTWTKTTPESIGAPDVEQVSGTMVSGGDSISFGPGQAVSNGTAIETAITIANTAYTNAMAAAPKGKVNGLLVRSGIQTLTNPTTIPVDGPERLDLVFTEPTTVAFATPHYIANPDTSSTQAPGVTDLVLSIEGYEHVTWSGVVVHGTPDQSGVVWASALWRQRDSTWHLLCEQDASKAGGGGVQIKTIERPVETFGPVGLAEYTAAIGLGGTPTPVTRTIAANGDVEHAIAPMPQSITDYISEYGIATTTYPVQNVLDVKTGATLKALAPIHSSAYTSPPGPRGPLDVTYFDVAHQLGMVVAEYGTISQPGGQGFRITLLALNVTSSETTVSFRLEVTANPFSFGKTSASVSTTAKVAPDLYPDFFYHLPFYPPFPWGFNPEADPTGQGPMLVFSKQSDHASHLRFTVSMSQSALDSNPLPTPPVADEDGFAIHTVDVLDAAVYQNNIWSRP